MKKLNILTDKTIKANKPKDKKYYLNDGDGLYLLITPNNYKIWVFRFMLNSKRYETTFKNYPSVSLSEARKKKDDYRKLINDKINPIHHFRELNKKQVIEDKSNLQSIFNEWIENQKSNSGLNQWEWKKLRIYKDVILPLGIDTNINDVTIDDIKKVLNAKSKEAPSTAKKLFNYLENILSYAISHNYLKSNVLSNVDKYHILENKPQRAKNHPQITNQEYFKELVNSIYSYDKNLTIRNALKLVLHIPLRAENLSKLRWDYIDFDNKLLTIPRAEMKAKNSNYPDFKMPLSDEVIKILQNQKEYFLKSEWVFCKITNIKENIDYQVLNNALIKMGFNNEKIGKKIRLHGFRGTFRSWINTLDIDNKFTFEVKEAALDHHTGEDTVKAYTNKSDYTKQLKPLMGFWSGFIVGLLEDNKGAL